MTAALHVFRRNWLVYRHVWRGSVFFSFLSPFLFLTAMGIGLGSLIARGSTTQFGGFDYAHFLGPGIMAATCMQTATFESTFPIMGKIMWRKNYEAMLATPLQVSHLLVGELSWIAFRLTTISTVFFVVLLLFRIPTTPLAILAIPSAVLTGLAFSAVIIAFAATQKNDAGFAALFRFVINPLFLFSGTFFPVERLPAALHWLAAATPLYHGVALTRGLVLRTAELGTWWLHAGYLVIFFGLAAALANRLLTRRLVK